MIPGSKLPAQGKLGGFLSVSFKPGRRNVRPLSLGGFTLIELLVVVLIIGILAAIAYPKYQRAVDKSRLSQVFVWAAPIVQAEKLYKMANGKYTPYMEDLDVAVPDCEFQELTYEELGGRGIYLCNGNWTVTLSTWEKLVGIRLPEERAIDAVVSMRMHFEKNYRECGSNKERWRKVCASFGGEEAGSTSSMKYWTIP